MGLKADQELPLPIDTEYTLTKNETRQDELWEDINRVNGLVALDKDWARQKDLPESYQFPWDENKAVYYLSGFHYLHCLVCAILTLRGSP